MYLGEKIKSSEQLDEQDRFIGFLRSQKISKIQEETVKDLLSFYNGDMRVYTSWGNRNKLKGFKIRASDRMHCTDFIGTVWTCAGTFDINSTVTQAPRQSDDATRAVDGGTLIIATRILEESKSSETSVSNGTWATRIRTHFESEMGLDLKDALESGWLGMFCPLIRVSTPSRGTGIFTL